MLWGSPARQRMQALDEKVEALNGRLDEVMARFDRLSGDLDRLSSDLEQVQQRLEAEGSSRRELTDQLSAVREVVRDLQRDGQRTADGVADLRTDGEATADRVAGHAALLEDIKEEDRRQGRALDQLRADVTRLDRQAAADLAELRGTHAALARAVLMADGARRRHEE